MKMEIFGQKKQKLERELLEAKAELEATKAELQATKAELQATKAELEAKQKAEDPTEGMAATERWKRKNAADKEVLEQKKAERVQEFYRRAVKRFDDFMKDNELVLAELIVFPKSGTLMYRRQGWTERSIIFGGSRRSEDPADYCHDIEMLKEMLAPLGWQVRNLTGEEEFFLPLEEEAP